MAFYNPKDYSYLLEHDCSVVITGDSLAYNRYDFVEEPRMNAYDCPFAMQSWSFMLRDFLISHSKGWLPAEKLKAAFEDKYSTTLIKKHDSRLPLVNQMPMDILRITNDGLHNKKQNLKGCPLQICCITQPDVSKAAFGDIIGSPDLFGGMYYKWFDINSLNDLGIRRGSALDIAGAAETRTKVFLTGSGSKTGEWMLDNINELVIRYNPNLVFMIIGANNRRERNPRSFKAALHGIIKELLSSGSELILISPPHSTTTDPEWGDDNIYKSNAEITKPILDILRKAAFEFNLVYIDLFEFFSGVPNESWRFDNTHFTKQGNIMLYEAIKNKLFGGML